MKTHEWIGNTTIVQKKRKNKTEKTDKIETNPSLITTDFITVKEQGHEEDASGLCSGKRSNSGWHSKRLQKFYLLTVACLTIQASGFGGESFYFKTLKTDQNITLP